jgi:hypothetical protein
VDCARILYTQTLAKKLRLPTAAGAAAAAAATAKTAESTTTAAARTATESSATASAEHATNHGAYPPAATSPSAAGPASGDGSNDVNNHENENENGPNGNRRRIISSPDGPNRRRCGERHAAIVGDILGELPGSGFYAGAVITLEKIRAHEPASVAGASVVDDWFEAVAYFDAVSAFGGRDEQEDTAIVFFVADTELLEEVVAILIDVLAFEGADSDDGHLGASFLFELQAEIFEAGFGVRVNQARKIGDIAGGMDIFDLFGVCGEREKQKNENEVRLKESRGPGKRFGRGQLHARKTIEVAQ